MSRKKNNKVKLVVLIVVNMCVNFDFRKDEFIFMKEFIFIEK